MPFLVDGDNFLGTSGRPRSDSEKRKLAAELARFSRKCGKKVLLIFDGNPPSSAGFGGNTEFSGSGRDADSRILERVEAIKDRSGWIVVTSDRSLGDQCRWKGTQVERSDRFRKRVAKSMEGEGEKPSREEDIEYWLEQFGEIDSDA